ncbi:DMT family transporter [Parvibacter caecicola]|uniref:DMT family transporter n=1 Tax=Parvibacter caecicola TaxID=747645 RepID=UPI00272F6A8D|nr:multidrug efflux SMR transporter [Parvibacter caecicola]
MAWLVLLAAGAMEAVWAIALERSQGFTVLFPSLVFFGALALSMLGLSFALRSIALGTAYAVWVGIGCALTAAYSMAVGAEPASLVRVALIAGLVFCVAGLKLVGAGDCCQ